MIGAHEFLKAVNEQGRSSGSTAFVVEFGGVQNFDDPTVARALLEHFETTVAGTAIVLARLAPEELACLSPADAVAKLVAAVDELDALVSEQALGSVRLQRYALPRDSRAFADRVRTIVGSIDPTHAAALRRDRRNDLAQLLRMEQMLRQADIEPLVHHQAVYDFAHPRAPVTVVRELTVAMDRLSERLGIAFATSPWLFDKVTLLLDRRMLFHLVHDRGRHAEPFAINLRVATVLDAGFPDLVARLAAKEHETLIVELSESDRTADPQAFAAAVRELDRLGIHIAFHAGGWPNLRTLVEAEGERLGGFLRQIDLLKVRWDSTDLDLTKDETDAMAALVRRAGPNRVVLERVENDAAIDFALRIGVHLLQGFGVTSHVQAQHDREHARAADRASRAARQAPRSEAVEAPRGILRKIFRI